MAEIRAKIPFFSCYINHQSVEPMHNVISNKLTFLGLVAVVSVDGTTFVSAVSLAIGVGGTTSPAASLWTRGAASISLAGEDSVMMLVGSVVVVVVAAVATGFSVETTGV
jgi:hypothetical protein